MRTSASPLLSPASSPWAIELLGLRKTYAQQNVVDGIDLQIPVGEFFGLLGPNGAGKTTTLRMLLGLCPSTAGEIRLLGCPIPQQRRAIAARLGVVPQFDTLDPDFTVEENLLTYASYFGLGRAQLGQRLEHLLQQANLTSRRHDRISSLSGGMKRRLTLARALVNAPELVILDEPTTGLDPQARHHLWRQLRSLRQSGVTLVLTTHYMEEAQELCDRVAIIDAGRIIACDAPQALMAAHVEPWVISLTADAAQALRSGAVPGLRVRTATRTSMTSAPDKDAVQSVRLQEVADTWLLYTEEPSVIRQILEDARIAHATRPSNLEDVFLRLTGHDLRD